MSAVLGPIHHVMYGRLQRVANRQQDLADFLQERMSPGQKENLLQAWTLRHEPPVGALEDCIAGQPIHAWLQQQMEALLLSEAQLWALAGDRPERLAQLQARLRAHGRETAEDLRSALGGADGADARQLLQMLDRALLTSMPCDRVAEVLAAGATGFIVRRDLLFHSWIWEKAGLAEATALAGHEAWIQGFCAAWPGAKLARADVSVNGRRLFDDRLTFQTREA